MITKAPIATDAAISPAWDRFARWPRAAAIVLLLALIALLALAAAVPFTVGKGEEAKPPPLVRAIGMAPPHAKIRPRDDDLRLYDTAITRIRRGENYYSFIVAEHRRAHYPVRPGLAVRLPTLAYLDVWLGVDRDTPAPGAVAAAFVLMLACVWAWWQRLGEEGCSPRERRLGTALMFFGASLGLNVYYFALHELWTGMLIALAFGLHRPGASPAKSPSGLALRQGDQPERGRWLAAWCVAALALAIRELTLPFVLLLGASALWRRAWGEAAAWGALAMLFGVGLGVHLHLIAAQTLPSDPIGPSWLAVRGLGGWLGNVTLASNLRFLPHYLAGPLIVAMLVGWAGWKTPAGGFGTLLYAGYGIGFMIFGRNDNFYWGAVVAPAMFIGLVFAPMAVSSLLRVALGRGERASALS